MSAQQVQRSRLSRFLAPSISVARNTARSPSYWQAFGIVVLAKLIFGAVGGRGGGSHGGRKHGPGRSHSDWGRPERWRHWREFWEQEGRAAFERFQERQRGTGPEKPAGSADTQS